jgi:hypothetical protein
VYDGILPKEEEVEKEVEKAKDSAVFLPNNAMLLDSRRASVHVIKIT